MTSRTHHLAGFCLALIVSPAAHAGFTNVTFAPLDEPAVDSRVLVWTDLNNDDAPDLITSRNGVSRSTSTTASSSPGGSPSMPLPSGAIRP